MRRITRNLLHRSITPATIGLLVFLVSIATFGVMALAEYEKHKANERAQATNYGNTLRTRVDRELNALLFISAGMSSYLTVYHRELKPEKLEAILADLYARSLHVRNLGVAVGYRITYVYPLKSNEKIIGVDFRDLPKQWAQVQRAVESRQGVLAGPLELVQGGKGLIYRYPVFIDGEYWGILSTVIDTDSFLQAAFGDGSAEDYAFAIRLKQSPTTPAFYGDPALFDAAHAFLMTSHVPNGQWEWAIVRKSHAYPRLVLAIGAMGFVISVLLSGLAYHQMHERSRLTLHAMQDSLTGLANRRLLQDRMQQAFEQARRFGRSMAVIYIDLDHFKRINDTHGHNFGDEFLKIAAKKLESCLRHVDTLSRIGGDEFVIVLEEIGEPGDVHVVADNIYASFKQAVVIHDTEVHISLSMGIAIFPPGSDLALPALTKQADIALYEAKAAGRNTYRVYGEA